MTQITVDLINQQAKQEGQPDGMVFGNIDGITTFDDLEAASGGDDPKFDDDDADDRSYLTRDDQSMDGDNEHRNGFEPIEEQYELETAQGDPGVHSEEEEEDDDALLEDLPNLDPPSEGDGLEPINQKN